MRPPVRLFRSAPRFFRRSGRGLSSPFHGNNTHMRDSGKSILETKDGVRRLKGVPLLVRIDSGRGKTTVVRGRVDGVFPAVFTLRLDNGEIRSFSYSDVHTRGVMFLPPDNDKT